MSISSFLVSRSKTHSSILYCIREDWSSNHITDK